MRLNDPQPADPDDAEVAPVSVRAVARLSGVPLPEAELTLDLVVPAEAVVIVTGPPGAGKTRLLDVLHMMRIPKGGRAAILGEDPRRLSSSGLARLRRRIGRLSQTARVFEHMSAFENVATPLRLAGRPERGYAGEVEELLTYVGLEPRDQTPAGALSETARRRIALARALAVKPDLLLADEPAAGLGPEAAGRMLKTLLAAPRMGASLVLATQDETLVPAAPKARWVAIEQGRMVARSIRGGAL